MKISETRIPRLKSIMRENNSENTEIVPKSSISERLAIDTKNQQYYTKYHSEIRFTKYCIVLIIKNPGISKIATPMEFS